MASPLTAKDLWPLIQKLAPEEQVRLVKALQGSVAGQTGMDSDAYGAAPVGPSEFSEEFSEEDPLAWDGDGWDEFSAAG